MLLTSRLRVGFLGVILVGMAGCSDKPKKVSQQPTSPAATVDAGIPAIKKLRPGRPFDGPMPDVCIILTGQMYGYLQPCGCSRPQVGGLERRYELMRRFAENGYVLSAGDLGDLAPREHVSPQNEWKFETAVKSLKSMSYAAMGLGLTELAMPIDRAFGLAQNYQPPFILSANLLDAESTFPDMFKPWVIDEPCRAENFVSQLGKLQGLLSAPAPGTVFSLGALTVSGRPKVGYLGLTGDSVIKEATDKKYEVKFTRHLEGLATALKPFLAAGPEVRVLLFQGTAEEAAAVLKAQPGVFHIALCRNDASDGVAPLLPIKHESGAWIIMVGHKGRSVGVLAYRRGKPLEYRLEELVEELELPDDKTNAAREIMKDYVWGVYKNGYLKNVARITHPHQLDPELKDAVFVGAGKCRECHPQAHGQWSASNHSHAWDNLVKNGRPIMQLPQKDSSIKQIGRQYDPDCARCHVTGFGYKGGFEDEVKTPHLLGNGCENCHGPGSLHAGQPGNPVFRKPMVLSMEDKDKTAQTCMKCHDLDNDPHFDIAKWEKIKHGREK